MTKALGEKEEEDTPEVTKTALIFREFVNEWTNGDGEMKNQGE